MAGTICPSYSTVPRWDNGVSMESGLDGRNNRLDQHAQYPEGMWSQWSPA